MANLYKIEKAVNWEAARIAEIYHGSALDLKDGFIHLSTFEQAQETARLHFSGQEDLVLIAIAQVSLVENLRWEASRGGQMFPHVYGSLDPADVLWVKPLIWASESHTFPREFFV